MTGESTELDSERTSGEPTADPQTIGSLLVSVSFWLVLLVAAGMYAAVALTPKMAAWINAHTQYADNASRLAALEDEADYLERVTAALKNDPAFAVQLVDATQEQPGPVTARGESSGGVLRTALLNHSQGEQSAIQPRLAGLVFHLASHKQHRTWLLVGSCSLTLLAFSMLNEAGSGLMFCMLSSMNSAVRTAVARYRRSPQEHQ